MISLQSFTPADFNRIINWVSTPELMIQFAGSIFTFPLTTKQLESYINDTNRFAFKVVDTNNRVIGHCEYYLTNNTCKLGRVLIGEESNRNKGFGKQIMLQLLRLSFKHANITMAELNVYDWNFAAIKCYEKVGFTINPNKKSVIEVSGESWTAINMTIYRLPDDIKTSNLS